MTSSLPPATVSPWPPPDKLADILEVIAEQNEAASVQAVLVSGHTGVTQFVEVMDNPKFREELNTALVSGAIPLGVMCFRFEDKQILYGRLAFPWIEEDPAASEAFTRICDEAEEKIHEEAKRWNRPQ